MTPSGDQNGTISSCIFGSNPSGPANIQRAAPAHPDKLGRFPTQIDLANINQTSLGHYISSFHGGFDKVRKELGYEPLQKPDGYWKQKKNVIKTLKIIESGMIENCQST